jgi:tetratricopeptide (TPR) repeat protein
LVHGTIFPLLHVKSAERYNNESDDAFSAGAFGPTVALNLVRALAGIDIDSAPLVLSAALQHPLIAFGLRTAPKKAALADVESSLGGSELQVEFQHARLMVQALEALNIARQPSLRALLMQRAYLVGQTGLAEQLARDALKNDRPNRNRKLIVECHNVLGRIASDGGDFASAAECFRLGAEAAHSAKLDHEEWDQRTNQVWCLQSLGDDVGALEEIGRAEAVARRTQDAKALAKTLVERGNSELKLGNSIKARQAFESVITLAEQSNDQAQLSNALGNLGNIASLLGDYQSAERHHCRAMAISRTLADKESLQLDLNNLAFVLWQTGRSEEAVEMQKEALSLAKLRNDQPRVDSCSAALARMLQTLGRHAGPASEGPASAPVTPHAPVKHPLPDTDYEPERMVRELLSQQKLEEARRFLEERLASNPACCNLLCLYGVLLFHSKEPEKARAQFERAIQLFPSAMEPHLRLVDLCTATGQLDALLVRYQRAIDEEPLLPAFRIALSLVCCRKGRLDEAIQQALEGARLAPGEELPLRNLAEVRLAKAVSLLPTNWDGAWQVFQDCATTLNLLTQIDSNQSGQWLDYAGKSFESFAEQSFQCNPSLMGGIGAEELSSLVSALFFFERAQAKDPDRTSSCSARRVLDTIRALAHPRELNLVAARLVTNASPQKALLLLGLSLEKDPDQAEAHHELARLLYLSGGPGGGKEALVHARRAVEIDPANPKYQPTVRFLLLKAPEGLMGKDHETKTD